MRLRRFKTGIVAFAMAALPIPAAASGETPSEVIFQGGALTGLAIDPSFTHGSFQNLSFKYEDCGSDPAELTCIWRVHAFLSSNPKTRCVPSTPQSQLLWDSGEAHLIAETGEANGRYVAVIDHDAW